MHIHAVKREEDASEGPDVFSQPRRHAHGSQGLGCPEQAQHGLDSGSTTLAGLDLEWATLWSPDFFAKGGGIHHEDPTGVYQSHRDVTSGSRSTFRKPMDALQPASLLVHPACDVSQATTPTMREWNDDVNIHLGGGVWPKCAVSWSYRARSRSKPGPLVLHIYTK